MSFTPAQRTLAEGVATWLLVTAVVGSGIMGVRLADGNVAIALLANTLATGAALVAIIAAFGPVSGAHMNPAVTLASADAGSTPWSDVVPYILAQLIGGALGTMTAHGMFGEPLIAASTTVRAGGAQLFSEVVATFGLVTMIWGAARFRPTLVPFVVGAYITAAYWFTASTSFANPAVTLARTLTDTFAGIRPVDAPAFIVAQLVGALAAARLWRVWTPASRP